MRRALLWAMSAMLTMLPTTAFADDSSNCRENNNHDLRIKGCSAVIGRNPNDAIAYYARGLAYQFAGDVDRAIADYTKAIELNPYHASAYDSRGRAYASKGDYAQRTRSKEHAATDKCTSAPRDECGCTHEE